VPTDAIVLAAGAGERLGGAVPKAFASLGDEPLVIRAVRAVAAGGVDRIVVVVSPDRIAEAAAILEAPVGKSLSIVAGGASRVESTRLGLASLRGDPADVVIVHDAARPLARPDTFRAAIEAVLAGADGASPTLPALDTIAFVAGERITEVPPRSGVARLQTPQAFRRAVLARAHEAAAAAGDVTATDDCGLVLRFVPGARIAAIAGDERNLKITTPLDLELATRLLAQFEGEGAEGDRSSRRSSSGT
jgi:2-C-methyl-D-erythritol 4-phosphate cytidylyltransferase